MAYPSYQNTYYPSQSYQNAYYPQPVPDQLAQLRQNQMQQPTPMMQPQTVPQAPQSSPIWVQGEEGAKAYMVAAGNSVMLMDSESNVFYIKSSDQSGMPLPLRIFDYTERTANVQPKPQAAPQFDPSQYITRDELEDILAERLKRPIKAAKQKEDTENMSNQLFSALGGSNGQQGGPMNMMNAFKQFMQQNQGKNPNEMIQQLLSSGKLNQQQLNQAQQMAKQMEGQFSGLKGMLGFK